MRSGATLMAASSGRAKTNRWHRARALSLCAKRGHESGAASEASTRAEMARISARVDRNTQIIKTLTIERHMAAARLKRACSEPLSKPDKLKDGFRDGTLPAIGGFSPTGLTFGGGTKEWGMPLPEWRCCATADRWSMRRYPAGRGDQATGLDAARAGV